jgi:hypothetical protein
MLHRSGYPVTRLRADEGGELARTESFMATCFDVLDITVETTGGYNLTANGKVEGSHCLAKRSFRCMLLTAGKTDNFWCFTTVYECGIKNNILHSRTKQVPETHFNPRAVVIPASSLPIWGSKMFIIKGYPNNIEPRSMTDPRAIVPLHRNEQRPQQLRSHDGYFMGFEGHSSVLQCFVPLNQIKRVYTTLYNSVVSY